MLYSLKIITIKKFRSERQL